MLQVIAIHTYYGLSHILFGVSLEVEAGEIVCLLGRNGAGKTTTLKSIMGLVPPRQGQVRFRDTVITGRPPFRLSRQGLGYVPDDRRIFADLTVEENLEIAARPPRGGTGWDRARVYALFPALQAMAGRKGGYLSGGEQKMLAIARALMGNPDLLLLDEPTEGLAPLLVQALEEQIRALREAGLTVLLAEQNVRSALRLADRGYVIDNGQVCFQGSTAELRDNAEVRQKYLLV